MKKIILLFVAISCLFAADLFAQVGINTTDPNSKSVLDLKSENKGLLIPRLTSVQISALGLTANEEGMMVYCTDENLFYYFDGTDWFSMPAWGQKVDLDNPMAKQDIFTTIINPNSNVGINTTTPKSKLTVMGNLAIGVDSIAPANGAYINGQVRMGINAGITAQLEVGGNINARGKLQENGNALLPAGAIIMWSGSVANIPAGWKICDGVGSPDLRGRFIVGAGDSYGVDDQGGFETVALTEAQMPVHDHGVTDPGHTHTNHLKLESGNSSGNPGRAMFGGGNDWSYNEVIFASWPAFTGITINNKGGNAAHENRPPYYALCYIIKL